MTKSLSAENNAALQQRLLQPRDFVWVIARDRTDGSPVPTGLWSDIGPITASVIDPDTGGSQSRSFLGAGGLIQISDIPLLTGLTAQTCTLTWSQLIAETNDYIRTYDLKQAQIQIFRGLFNPGTRQMVAPAFPRFVGFVDKISVLTPTENNEGSVTVTCNSHTQEMTRYNPDTRSDASQRLRNAADNFFQDTTVVGDWQLFWGKAGSTSASTTATQAMGGH